MDPNQIPDARPLAEARLASGSWGRVLWGFISGQPAFRVAPYRDAWFRLVGIPGVAALAHIYNLNMVPEQLTPQLHPLAWLHTGVFVFVLWHLGLQISYWLDARLGVQDFPVRLRHQFRWVMVATHIVTALSGITHFWLYGFSASAVVLGAKYYVTILVVSVFVCAFYVVYYAPVFSLRARMLAIQQAQSPAAEASAPATIADKAPPAETLPPGNYATPAEATPPERPANAPVAGPVRLELVSKTIFLPEDRIEHVFIENRVVFIQTTTGDALVTKYITLAEVEALLSGAFYRLNRQLLIHRSTVTAYRRQPNGNLAVEARLAGKPTALNVSRYKAAAFREWVGGTGGQ